jgi:2,6-dihydroxypseudooxynicotine hydrolase
MASSVRKHAAQSNLFSRILSTLRGRSIPSFLVNRAAANGLIREEVETALRQAKRWEHLPHIFSSIAGELHEKALYWDDLGLNPRAAAHYLQSSFWDFYAQLLILRDQDNRSLFYARCSRSYRHAAPHFEYAATAVEIPYQAGSLKGYLRLPVIEAHAQAPCVVIVNSVNSAKEELHYTENAFLKMGIATLSFDLPGFGESFDDHLDSGDFEILGNALYLFLNQHKEIDPERLALHGLGIGGALALTLVLLTPDRYQAVATLSAPYQLESTLERLLPAVRREALSLTDGAEDVLRGFATRMPRAADLRQLTCPLMAVGGGKDILAPASDTKSIYDLAGSVDKKLLFIPNASHGCYEMMPSLRYEIAQWIRQRV